MSLPSTLLHLNMNPIECLYCIFVHIVYTHNNDFSAPGGGSVPQQSRIVVIIFVSVATYLSVDQHICRWINISVGGSTYLSVSQHMCQ